MCQGKSPIPFRKSRRLRSLISCTAVIQPLSEHMSTKPPFAQPLRAHSQPYSFPGRRSQQDHVGCWQYLKSVPVCEHCFIPFPGDGTWGFSRPLSPAVEQLWSIGWPHDSSVLLSTGDIETSSICIQKSSCQPSCSGWNWINPQGFLWCLPNLYSQIVLELTRLCQMKEWARLTFAFH